MLARWYKRLEAPFRHEHIIFFSIICVPEYLVDFTNKYKCTRRDESDNGAVGLQDDHGL